MTAGYLLLGQRPFMAPANKAYTRCGEGQREILDSYHKETLSISQGLMSKLPCDLLSSAGGFLCLG